MQGGILQVKYPENVEDSVPLNLKEVKKSTPITEFCNAVNGDVSSSLGHATWLLNVPGQAILWVLVFSSAKWKDLQGLCITAFSAPLSPQMETMLLVMVMNMSPEA